MMFSVVINIVKISCWKPIQKYTVLRGKQENNSGGGFRIFPVPSAGGANLVFDQFSPANHIKWKKLDPGVSLPPLDPPKIEIPRCARFLDAKVPQKGRSVFFNIANSRRRFSHSTSCWWKIVMEFLSCTLQPYVDLGFVFNFQKITRHTHFWTFSWKKTMNRTSRILLRTQGDHYSPSLDKLNLFWIS